MSVNGQGLDPVALIETLNAIGGKHGVGVVDLVEDRLVGMKSRGVYETPGGALLYSAHSELEQLVLDRRTLSAKDLIAPRYADLVYECRRWTTEREAYDAFVIVTQESVSGTDEDQLQHIHPPVSSYHTGRQQAEPSAGGGVEAEHEYEGRWWTTEREAYDAFVTATQARVSGTVALRLYKGSATVVGRESAHALYDERFVTFGEDDVYQQSDAAGFIRLFALPARVRALKDQEIARTADVETAGGIAHSSQAPDAASIGSAKPLEDVTSSSPELAVA